MTNNRDHRVRNITSLLTIIQNVFIGLYMAIFFIAGAPSSIQQGGLDEYRVCRIFQVGTFKLLCISRRGFNPYQYIQSIRLFNVTSSSYCSTAKLGLQVGLSTLGMTVRNNPSITKDSIFNQLRLYSSFHV